MSRLFEPLTLREVSLPNRVMMSPLSQHRATSNGSANTWHLVHYGSRAMGGVGLIMVEDCAVTSNGRISGAALGLYKDAQIKALRRVTSFCRSTGSRVGIQLGHAGRKAFSANGDVSPPAQVVGPTDEPYRVGGYIPVPLDEDGCNLVVAAFASAARRAVFAGFDIIEIHAAHGYLLHEFLSPLTNTRNDDYGGDPLRNRLLLQRVVDAVRAACGDSIPVFLRISAVDWEPGGLTLADTAGVISAMVARGVDVIDVSAGGLTTAIAGLQTVQQIELARDMRARTGTCTVGVGGVTEPAAAEALLEGEACDIVAVGRALLQNPFWLRNAMVTAPT